MGFGDFAFSAEIRDTLNKMVATTVQKIRPAYRYGVIQSIDSANYKCTVLLNGDPNPIIVSYGYIQPTRSGQVVRVDGNGTDKFITDVVGYKDSQWFLRTPTIVSGVTNIGNATHNVRYKLVGSILYEIGQITFGSTTTFLNQGAITIDLPYTIFSASDRKTLGTVNMVDQSTGAFYERVARAWSANSWTMAGEGMSYAHNTSVFPMAAGDSIGWNVCYEVSL